MGKVITPQLIKIVKNQINGAEINSVNLRDLHKAFELKSEFANWLKEQVEILDTYEEGIDYIRVTKDRNDSTVIVKAGLSLKGKKSEYIVSLDMAKHLAMLSKSKKGKQVRKYFIQIEKEANRPMTVDELLAYNQKVIDKIKSENLVLTKKVEQNKPKVLFADSVAQSDNSILIGQFAKAISTDDFKIGQNKLFQWLRDNKYLIASGSRFNQPMQKYIDNGYFEITERTINNPDGSVRITITTKITGKGQVALTNKIRGI